MRNRRIVSLLIPNFGIFGILDFIFIIGKKKSDRTETNYIRINEGTNNATSNNKLRRSATYATIVYATSKLELHYFNTKCIYSSTKGGKITIIDCNGIEKRAIHASLYRHRS